MSPITAQQAWDATDPSQTDEERQKSAEAMMAGVAANDAYLSSRPELEQLIAKAQGGQVVAHADINSDTAGEIPTESGPQTVEGSVVPGSESESGSILPPQAGATSVGGTDAGVQGSGDSAEDKLRAQLLRFGITPDV